MLSPQLQAQFQGLSWFAAASVAALSLSAMRFLCMRVCFGRIADAAFPKPRLVRQLALLSLMTPQEKAALAAFLFFLMGAGTSNFHKISPAWLAALLLAGLLLMGLISEQAFQQKIDWPMNFFLLGVEGLSRAIVYLKLDASLGKSVSTWFDFVGGNILVFILVVLVVTLVIRQALPIQAGMIVSAVILIPIAEAQFISPWIVVFLTSMFSDIWFASFMFYNLLTSLARVVAVYLSVPYWQWLGIIRKRESVLS